MLAWVAAIMIGIFLLVCGVIITASFYQIFKVIRHIPRKPKAQYNMLSNGTGAV